MTLMPLLDAPLIIQLHVAAAVPAMIVGPVVLFARIPGRWHRMLGYAWVTALAMMALTGLFIPSFDMAVLGHLGPIHLLSFFTLWGIGNGVWLARKRRIAEHRQAMKSTWFGAMRLAGLLTFLPGRRINQVVFGGPSDAGWLVIGAGVILLALLWHRDRGQNLRAA